MASPPSSFWVRTDRASRDDTTAKLLGPSVSSLRSAFDFLVELGDERAHMPVILRDDRGEFLAIGEDLAYALDAHIDDLERIPFLGHGPIDFDGRARGLNDLRVHHCQRVGLGT